MKIRDIMETNVITIKKDASYEEAAKILYEKNVSGVPVVDDSGAVVGIVSEKDIVRVLYPFYQSYYEQPVLYTDYEDREKKATEIRNQTAEIFMTKNVVPVSPDDAIMQAGALMLAKGINRLPVVEDGKVIGIVSRRMIFRAILRENFKLEQQ